MAPAQHQPLKVTPGVHTDLTGYGRRIPYQAQQPVATDRHIARSRPRGVKRRRRGWARHAVWLSRKKRLLALLAGNRLSYVVATSAPVAPGFWDR